MNVCRRCGCPITAGQKVWRLGTDIEHDDCDAYDPSARLPQIRAALRYLNAAGASLSALGKRIFTSHMHRQPNAVSTRHDGEIARIVAQLKRAVAELERRPDDRKRGPHASQYASISANTLKKPENT